MTARQISLFILLLITLTLWASAAHLANQTTNFRASQISTRAQIVDFEAKTMGRHRRNCPILAYTYLDIHFREVDQACWQHKVAGSFPGKGEMVTVLIDPQQPEKVMIDSFVRLYLYSLAMAFVAFILSFWLLLYFFFGNRLHQSKRQRLRKEKAR